MELDRGSSCNAEASAASCSNQRPVEEDSPDQASKDSRSSVSLNSNGKRRKMSANEADASVPASPSSTKTGIYQVDEPTSNATCMTRKRVPPAKYADDAKAPATASKKLEASSTANRKTTRNDPWQPDHLCQNPKSKLMNCNLHVSSRLHASLGFPIG